jgi:hypothetical protein
MNKNAINMKIIAAGIVLTGPYLTIGLVRQLQSEGYILRDQYTAVAAASLLLWSPLFFSVPALIQQRIRDGYKSTSRGVINTLLRGLTLPLYLVKNPESRVVTIASYMGLLIGAWAAVNLA